MIISNEKIADRKAVQLFLEQATKATNMKILAGSLVAESQGDNPGFSGFVVIDFSHISVHTFTKPQEALIDIFSCRPFDRDTVEHLCQEFLGLHTPTLDIKKCTWDKRTDTSGIMGKQV